MLVFFFHTGKQGYSEDAYVVGLAYFPPDYVQILNPAVVVAVAKGEGISLSNLKQL